MIAAERDQDAVLQRHRALLQALAVDEGAVGAGQVLDVGAAALQEDVRVSPREVAELLRHIGPVAGERLVGLADEEGKARDDDRLEAEAPDSGVRGQRERVSGRDFAARRTISTR